MACFTGRVMYGDMHKVAFIKKKALLFLAIPFTSRAVPKREGAIYYSLLLLLKPARYIAWIDGAEAWIRPALADHYQLVGNHQEGVRVLSSDALLQL